MSTVGLCEKCRHAQIIQNNRGNKFYLCLRSQEEASFAKYPRLPVLACGGYKMAEDADATILKQGNAKR